MRYTAQLSQRLSGSLSSWAHNSVMPFFPETLSGWLTAAKDFVTTLAVVIAGAWATRKYVFLREDSPRINFAVDCEFTGRHTSAWVVSIVAHVENVGNVPYRVKQLDFDVRYLTNSDPLRQGPETIAKQLEFPNVLIEGSWKPAKGTDTMVLMPGVKLTYRHVCWLSQNARFVLIHGRMTYPRFSDFHRADKLIEVPRDDSMSDSRA